MPSIDWDRAFSDDYQGEQFPLKEAAVHNANNGGGISHPEEMWEQTFNQLRAARTPHKLQSIQNERFTDGPAGGGLPEVDWQSAFSTGS
jgi:hypothetical protein